MFHRVLPALAVASAFALPTAAQLCPSGADTFWKNDNLADVPAGVISVSVIPGLCEGEACAAVFDLGGASSELLTQVTVGFGSAGGAQGATALVNVEIYDGVSFVGKDAFLGPKVFDLESQTGSSLQVTSTGLNSFDMTQFGVTVGNNPNGNYVVAFRMSFNPNGSCAGGFTSNFATDNSSPPFGGCNAAVTPPGKNLIDVTGEPNWQDCNGATVGGVPLCPLFYSGNWIIRACTESSATCQPDLGFQGPGTATLSVCGEPLAGGGVAEMLLENAPTGAGAVLFAGLFNNPFPLQGGMLVPVPWVVLDVFVTNGSGQVSIPISSAGGPITLYAQFVVVDGAQPGGYQFSNAVQMNF